MSDHALLPENPMSETINSSGPAEPYCMPEPAASNEAQLPPLTKISLNALCDAEVITPAAWLKAIDFCGFRPDGKTWLTYWRQVFLLGGALSFLAGVICFVAWNWGAMQPLARMALMGGLVAAAGLGAVLLGPDTRLGRVLLLACGIAIGPMLAVFGQTYQTGAELWELFRVWAALLVLLAIVGKQAGLWFAAWLAGNIFLALWLGRSLVAPLDALEMFCALPEWLIVIACALILWEWAAQRALRGQARRSVGGANPGAEQNATHSLKQGEDQGNGSAWLCVRWLPRLLFVDLTARTAFFFIILIDGGYFGSGFQLLWLPPQFVVGFAVGMAGFSWWWYRYKQPDLFMLTALLGAGVAVLVSVLARAELFLNAGGSIFFLMWGLMITGITAGLAKFLPYLQSEMFPPRQRKKSAGLSVPSLFGPTASGVSWQALSKHLQASGALSVPQLQPDSPPDAQPASQPLSLHEHLSEFRADPSPWYVRTMLAFGGWNAAALFIGFFGFLLFAGLHISANEELIIFTTAVPVLLLGRSLLPKEHMFARHFGFAMAIAGSVGVLYAVCASLRSEALACFALALVLVALCILMRNSGYTGIASVVIGNSVAAGITILQYTYVGRDAAPFMIAAFAELHTVWWALICMWLAYYCLHEEKWRAAARKYMADAWFYGFYASLLIFVLTTLDSSYGVMQSIRADIGLSGMGVGHYGLGAALAVSVLAYGLSKNAGKNTQMLIMAGMPIVFVLSWYQPGVVMALLGLALARQMGSVVMQGCVLAYFFAYIIYYYYCLAVPFWLKSVYLIATGLGLLALALVLQIGQAKISAEGAAHA